MAISDLLAQGKLDGNVITAVLLIDDIDPGVCVMAYRDFQSKVRTCVFNDSFVSVSDAKEFCSDHFGIVGDAWSEPPKMKRDFSFTYKLSTNGCPEPIPTEAVGVARFKCYREGDRLCVDLGGDREGLLTLARYLVLAADSQQYDDWYHRHFTSENGSEIELTIRGPGYLLEDGGTYHFGPIS